jgi:hypothetical protein
MAMRLNNVTNWDTRQFKSFIRAVALKEALTPEDIGKLVVTLQYRRHSYRWSDNEATGWGSYSCWKFKLCVVKDVPLDKVELARTIGVMLTYNQGVHARQVRHDANFYGTDWREKWAWVKELPLEMQKDEPEVKPGRPFRLAKKMEHCLQQIVVWEKRAKLAETKLNTWRKKLRYYELTLVKQAPAAQEPDPVPVAPQQSVAGGEQGGNDNA